MNPTMGPMLAGTLLSHLTWVPMSSSNVSEAAYDDTQERLYIRFKNGSLYKYEDVPAMVWAQFCAAPSKGAFVFDVIRGRGTDSIYAYSRMV